MTVWPLHTDRQVSGSGNGRHKLLISLLVALLGAAAFMSSLTAPAALAAGRRVQSENWAGYVVTRPGSFSRVIGEWVQPRASCRAAHASFSAFWIGIGGFRNGARGLEQIGTDMDCSPEGHPVSYAWYELIPAAPVNVPLKVHSGDRMAASVTISGSRAALHIRDLTSGHSYITSRSATNIDVTSAEWIAEAPTGCEESGCHVLPLANFGSVTFTGARAYAEGGVEGSIAFPAFSFTQVRLGSEGGVFPSMAGGQGGRPHRSSSGAVASVSTLSESGSSFTVTKVV